MNNILPWVKAHWIIVVSVAVMLIAPPLMVYFAGRMSGSLVAEVQQQIDADVRDITSSRTVKYSVPAPKVGDPAFELTAAPNQKLIDAFRDQRLKQAADLAGITKVAVDFNRGNRKQLVENALPNSDAEKIRRLNFQTAYVKNAYPALLKSLKIGGPQDPEILGPELVQKKIEVLQRLTGKEKIDKDQPPPDEVAQAYFKEMKAYRMQRARAYASTLSMFIDTADLEAIFYIPKESGDIDMRQIFDLQWNYWIREDILKACVRASQDVASAGVPGAVVKRIESLALDSRRLASGPDVPLGGDPSAAVPIDVKESITGRFSGPGSNNGFYEVRKATLTAIVSRANVGRLADALAATNFMTVIGFRATEVIGFDDIKVGYDYGDEPVIRATFEIETIWIREWMKPFMPKAIREEMGVPEDPAPPPGEPGSPETPPPG